MVDNRFVFGPSKYAAFNLVVAKWLRKVAIPAQKYRYVTLGGTELYDVANLNWINNQLIHSVFSYELQKTNYVVAEQNANRFRAKGIDIQVINGDIFNYRRNTEGDLPHIYYIDFTGIVGRAQSEAEFATWFDREVILPGDFLLITSYLGGRKPIIKRIPEFTGEFRKLRLESLEEKIKVYQIAHPLFVLSRAIISAGLKSVLDLNCLGCVKYRARKELMGLYGISCQSGNITLNSMSLNIPFFDMVKKDWFISAM
jgi:hypothetical protein